MADMKIYQEVELSLTENLIPTVIHVKQFDHKARKVRCLLYTSSVEYTIPEGAIVSCADVYKRQDWEPGYGLGSHPVQRLQSGECGEIRSGFLLDGCKIQYRQPVEQYQQHDYRIFDCHEEQQCHGDGRHQEHHRKHLDGGQEQYDHQLGKH